MVYKHVFIASLLILNGGMHQIQTSNPLFANTNIIKTASGQIAILARQLMTIESKHWN